jgi:hypothetical protein
MRKEYDFSKARNNPLVGQFKSVTHYHFNTSSQFVKRCKVTFYWGVPSSRSVSTVVPRCGAVFYDSTPR